MIQKWETGILGEKKLYSVWGKWMNVYGAVEEDTEKGN